MPAVEQIVRQLLKARPSPGRGDVRPVVAKPGDHAHHVAVDHGVGLVERDTRHGSGSVRAYAWQSADRIIIAGETACGGDLTGCRQKIPSTRIVSKPAPA